jgi:chemotaxis protein CheD
MQHVVNISDAKHSKSSGDTIVTYSLGSCIGVMVYDPVAQMSGMLHFQLPSSTMDPDRAKKNPLMFADSGLNTLIDQMVAGGANKRRLKIKIAGGANMFESTANTFDIGKRNHTAIRKALWQHGLFVDAEEVGGNVARTVYMNVTDGKVTLKRGGQSVDL